jgi:hypothetical protein
MKKISSINWLLALCVGYMLTGCGIHYTIKGQVVDAVTSQPVQGAVVAINWQRDKLLSPPGYGPERVRYGTTDSLTDAQGNFTITKYMVGEFNMGVYKPGYICWSNETIFNPKGKTYKEMYLARENLSLQDGMIIELQPIKGKDFPVFEHANFVSNLRYPLGSRKFSDATQKEEDFFSKEYRKRIGKDK